MGLDLLESVRPPSFTWTGEAGPGSADDAVMQDSSFKRIGPEDADAEPKPGQPVRYEAAGADGSAVGWVFAPEDVFQVRTSSSHGLPGSTDAFRLLVSIYCHTNRNNVQDFNV